MKKTHLYKAVIFSTCLGVTGVAAAWCPPYIVEWVRSAFNTNQKSLISFFSGVMNKITLQNKFDTERTTSAIAILTKQKAIGAHKIMQTQTKSNELMAKAYATIKQNERVKEARLGFGAEFGQGYDVCKVSATRELLTDKWHKNEVNTESAMKNELDSPLGGHAVSRDVVKARLLNQFKTYCTADQERLGLCKQTAQKNQNLQIATLFQNTVVGTPEHQAKIDFVNQLVGLPDDMAGKAQTKNGQVSIKAMNYELMKAQKDALNSPAIYSLKYIQNLYTKQGDPKSASTNPANGNYKQTTTPAVGNKNNTSPMELMQYEAKRYMAAGEDGQNWYKSMTTQHQRGLLLELLKIKSLDLNIQYKQYQQQSRTELILANLLAAEAQKLQETAPN